MNEVIVNKPTPLAKCSLYLSLLGLFLIGPFGLIPAIICGHMASSRIKKSSGSLSGQGQAKAGLAIGYIGLVFQIFIVFGILLPMVMQVKEKASLVLCMNNLKTIMLSAKVYSEDNEGKFPPNIQSIAKYIDDPRVFICPKTKHLPGNMSEIEKWSDYVLVPNLKYGSLNKVVAYSKPECYNGMGGNITFMDSTTRWCPTEEYNQLIKDINQWETK